LDEPTGVASLDEQAARKAVAAVRMTFRSVGLRIRVLLPQKTVRRLDWRGA
jgi:hypothetical protein